MLNWIYYSGTSNYQKDLISKHCFSNFILEYINIYIDLFKTIEYQDSSYILVLIGTFGQ